MSKNRNSDFLGLAAFFLLLTLGLLLILWPSGVLQWFPPLVGVLLALAGVAGILQLLFLGNRLVNPTGKMMHSIANLLVGIVFVVRQDVSLVFLSVLFGLYVLFSGAIHLTKALQGMREKGKWATELTQAILQFILGGYLLLPHSSETLWARVLGGYFIFIAANSLYWYLKIKRTPNEKPDAKENEPPSHT